MLAALAGRIVMLIIMITVDLLAGDDASDDDLNQLLLAGLLFGLASTFPCLYLERGEWQDDDDDDDDDDD